VAGRKTPTRACVIGPVPTEGSGGGGGGPANDASPEVPLEGDTAEEEGINAAPEAELEGDAEAPEAVLEDGEGAPKLELEGSKAAPVPELEGDAGAGLGTTTGASARRRGESPAGDEEATTCSCTNRKQCSSK
jgi:hypothetical protein